MPRELRIEYPGAIYHVLNRGDQRDDTFLDDEDRHKFLTVLEQACRKTDWQVHAYCLMRNHFHLVIETPANLVAGSVAETICNKETTGLRERGRNWWARLKR